MLRKVSEMQEKRKNKNDTTEYMDMNIYFFIRTSTTKIVAEMPENSRSYAGRLEETVRHIKRNS